MPEWRLSRVRESATIDRRVRCREEIMRKLARWILAAALLAPWAALPATAQSRIALVLGNSAYERGPIRTSLADAGLVAEALNGIGFEIMEAADLDQTDLRRAFSDFISRVQAAGPDAIAFVYFSGYALDRKSTRLNSSHVRISYAVFCL